MGSPELTKMADFVGAARVPEIDGAIADMAAAAIQDRAGPACPGLNDPALGPVWRCPGGEIRPPRSPGRGRSHRGSALTDRPAGGAVARLSAPARLTGPPTGAWAHSRHRKKRESYVRGHLC